MPSEFSLSGLLRLDANLTNTVTVGSVADTATVLETIAYTNGTGAGQANIYARFSGTLAAAGSTASYTLASLTVPTQSATTYTINVAKLRLVYLKNNHATQRLLVSFLDAADEIISKIEVRGKGVALWSCGTSTVEESRITHLTVEAIDNVANATYDLVLAGIKA